MKSGEPNPSKELYRQLRTLPWEQLWTDEVPRFDRAAAAERLARVGLIRAVGVVFSESGPAKQKEEVSLWLLRLLNDPCEKIRRYAMAAMPKIGVGPREEARLLALLRTTDFAREKKFLGRALDKIGGAATLEILEREEGVLPSQTVQKVKASVARSQDPSAIRMDGVLTDFTGLRIHLRGRQGLEQIVRDEVEDSGSGNGKFRVLEVRGGLVVIRPMAPFSLGDIYAMRCFGTVSFVLGNTAETSGGEAIEDMARIVTSAQSRRILKTFTEGAIRYRLDFISKGHQRGAVRMLASRAYELCPEILNDARNAPWSIDIHPAQRGCTVELRPRLTPDPRFYYRRDDVPAASHPPLAACMARLAGKASREVVWDPFCGSGLELIERALRGGVHHVYGTDRSVEAVGIAQENFAAAKLASVQATFARCDFRDFATIDGLGPNTVTLIMTNPPMGMRVPVPNLRGLIEDLFEVAAAVLRPGGRLVFANPMRVEPRNSSLQLQSRQIVDLGGFDVRLEMHLKQAQ